MSEPNTTHHCYQVIRPLSQTSDIVNMNADKRKSLKMQRKLGLPALARFLLLLSACLVIDLFVGKAQPVHGATATRQTSQNEEDQLQQHYVLKNGIWTKYSYYPTDSLLSDPNDAEQVGSYQKNEAIESTRTINKGDIDTDSAVPQWKLAGLQSDSLTIDNNDNRYAGNMQRTRQRSSCPTDCRCGLVTGITCYSPSGNTPLPSGFPWDTKILTLYGFQNITNQLENLTHLQKLNIYDGNLEQIPSLPRSVTHLDIINCNLKSLKNINSLSYLQSLNAAYNNLTDGQLSELTHLISLDLSHNPLERVPDVPSSLTVLNLINANLDKQPITWDIYLPNLKKLVLTGIKMTQPPYLNLPKLEYLDLSRSSIRQLPYLSGLPNLKEVDLSHTAVRSAVQNHFNGPAELKKVDLSYTLISELPDKLFLHNPNLREIIIQNTNIEYVKDYTFSGLYDLEELIINNNENLTHIDDISFRTLTNLKVLDISNSQVKLLPYSINSTKLTKLRAENVTFFCDCHAYWFPEYLSSIKNQTTIIGLSPMRCSDGITRSQSELEEHINNLGCSSPQITSTPKVTLRRGIGKTALLECNSTGLPMPMIIWHSPDKKYYTYNHTDAEPWFSDKFKYILDHLTNETSDPPIDPRILPLKSGHLLIQNLTRDDVGLYRCTAVNAGGSVTTTTFLWLTTTEMESFQLETLLFGLACAMTFLLGTLIVQLIRYIMDRMGWECCCCRGRISSKAQQVKRLLESVESYKSQQLDRLKENYNSQVVTIKESCYQQMDKLSESYAQQCRNLQSLKDYSAQQLTTVRDQYLEQVNRVRDYSVGQMNRVGENYVFQRQRIRKFSAHQMFKLRETYKYQQKTLNKILENIPDLYLQNCRTGGNCNRTDSMIFDDEIHGIDAYYRLDFLNPIMPSNEGSEDCFYTPSSTLTNAQRQHIIQQHMRQPSNCSTNISMNDYHEAAQSWATNTPAISPGSSPSHLTPRDDQALAQQTGKHNALKHTRSLSISSPNKAYQPSSHRRTHSASMNRPAKIHHQKTSPPLVEKVYWVEPKQKAITDKPLESPKASDSDGSDNETASMLKQNDHNSKRSHDTAPDNYLYYAKLVPQIHQASVHTKGDSPSAEDNLMENRSLEHSNSSDNICASSNASINIQDEALQMESSDNDSITKLRSQLEMYGKDGEMSVYLSANDPQEHNCNEDREDEDEDSANSLMVSAISRKEAARRKSLSREGSRETDGRCVLPSVTEDNEPTPSSSESQL